MEIFDISRTLHEGMDVWPGDPEFRLRSVLRIRDGEAANVSELRTSSHAGTHIDAPLHLDDSGKDAAGLPLYPFVGPVRLARIDVRETIRASDLSTLDWRGVERILFNTQRSDGKAEFSFLDQEAAEFLAQKGMLLVGTDAPSIESEESRDLSVHRVLLSRGIAILEGARLQGIPPGDYTLVALPLKIARADGSPVRAILFR